MCCFGLKHIKYKGQWKKGFPNGYGFLNIFNFKYEGNLNITKNIEKSIIYEITFFLLYFIEKLIRLSKITYLLIFILIVSFFIKI